MSLFENSSQIDIGALQTFIFYERKAGFADRFMRMRSAVQAGEKLNVPVLVFWPVNDKCNDHYLNLFEEIDNVHFVNEEIALRLRNDPRKIADALIDEHSERWPSPNKCFSILKLRPKYLREVKAFVAQNEITQAIGFHVRKTDIVTKEIKRGISIQYKVFDQVAIKSKKRIFLATDDQAVRKEFVEKYGEKIVFYNSEFDTQQLRQTRLETAVVELFVLSHCSRIHGTKREDGAVVSAFSKMAEHLGKARRENALPGFENTVKPGRTIFSSAFKKILSAIPKRHN